MVVAVDRQQAVQTVLETTQIIVLEGVDEGVFIHILEHPRLLLVLFNDSLPIGIQDTSTSSKI